VQVVDRRLVGADWQLAPLEKVTDTPVAVFWSLKGGVGRSTALCVAASELSRQGFDILALDLDLEAPGIGEMLLREGERPEYGALDFFVENGFGTVDDAFLRSMMAPSRLTDGRGLVSVVPATGYATDRAPQNMLAKLARAYIDIPASGGSGSFLHQTRDLVQRLTRATHYDAVLVDARAGLNESSAASLLSLGGTVLLFGVDTPQTFRGYRSTFAHLNRFVISGAENTWRERLQMVHSKAVAISAEQKNFRDRSFDLFSEWMYEEAEFNRQDVFNFDLDDDMAPHFPWPILHDGNFLEFDPIAHPEQLAEELCIRTFGNFVGRLARQLELPVESSADLRF
jgi:MinD-like ATPase involved in chromosome partitioning or flagellar assembly